jgi:hypothetical protein
MQPGQTIGPDRQWLSQDIKFDILVLVVRYTKLHQLQR